MYHFPCRSTLAVAGVEGSIYGFYDIELMKRLEPLLVETTTVMHNATFDYDVLYNNGINLQSGKLLDTKLLAAIADGTRTMTPTFGLKSLVAAYPKYRYDYLILDTSKLSEYPLEIIALYNAEDVHATRLLFKYFVAYLLSDTQMSFTIDVHSSAIKAISEVQRLGIPLNMEDFQALLQETKKKSEESANVCITLLKEQFGVKLGMNLNSTLQVGTFLKLQLQNLVTLTGDKRLTRIVNRYANKKAISTAHDELQDLQRCLKQIKVQQSSFLVLWLDTLLIYRQSSKLLSTFLEGFLKHIRSSGRVRANYNLTGTRTGRLSSSAPNLQNIPPGVRKAFQPRKGYKFVRGDLSQIELRVAASIANDPVMIKAYANNGDLHVLTASMVSGVPKEDVTEEMRQKAKAINFGFIYGMSANSFRGYALAQYNVIFSAEEAVTARNTFFSTYQGLAEWHEKTRSQVFSTQCVTSPFGRVYYLQKYISETDIEGAVRKGLNYPVQGSASDLTMWILGTLFDWKIRDKRDVTLVGTVHDDILSEVEDSVTLLTEAKIHDITASAQEKFSWLRVPLVMDVEIKDCW